MNRSLEDLAAVPNEVLPPGDARDSLACLIAQERAWVYRTPRGWVVTFDDGLTLPLAEWATRRAGR